MRSLKLMVLLGIATAGQALAAPPDDAPAAVTVLRGSSAPAPPPSASPELAPTTYREVAYVPVYYYLAVPFRVAPYRPTARPTHR